MATQPSIPVLQSDTFEIQRQKINNFAADSGYPSGGTNLAATNGYTKLPSGIILQWGYALRAGSVSVANNNGWYWYGQTITFPIAFPNGCFNITANVDTEWYRTLHTNSGDTNYYTGVYPRVTHAPFVFIDTITNSNFKAVAGIGYEPTNPSSPQYYWSAIGY